MNTVEKIHRELGSMTKSERRVASYFLGHLNDFAFYTLDRLATEIGTSTTSVIRFCRRLGFAGFKGFQEALRSDLKSQPDLPDKFQRTLDITASDDLLAQTIQQDLRCLQQTFRTIPYESLAAAVRDIAAAGRVFTFGMKESFALAHYLYTRLLTVRANVYLLNAGYNGEVEPVLSLTPDDVCIVFLFHRYTRQTLKILPLLKKQGSRVILVTSEPYEKVENSATLLIPCRVDANGIKNTAIAPICLSDYLCNAVAVRGGEETLQYMRRTEEVFRDSCVLGS